MRKSLAEYGIDEDGKKKQTKSYEVFYNLGIKRYNVADYDKALNVFEQALKAFKNLNKSLI